MKQLFTTVGIAVFVSAVYLFINSAAVSAQCTTVYGGGTTCPSVNIGINKQVVNPSTGGLVDNLTFNDPKIPVDTVVTYRLFVTNTGGTTFSTVTVRDIFPEFINFVSGPGNFDNNTRTLTVELTNLQPGETRPLTVQGRTVADNKLPSDVGVVCNEKTTNKSSAITNDGKSAFDDAMICIERKVLGGKVVITPANVKQVPATGVNILQLLALIPTALAGLTIRRAAIAQKAL